jgi:CRP/FNR family transcriptional regulator
MVQQLCKALGFDRAAMRGWDDLIVTRLKLRKGATLFHAGDRFSSLYVIRVGSCKTVLLTEEGEEQVAGYYIAGDIVGIDGLGEERHGCHAIALEDTELCAIPFERLRVLACVDRAFQHTLHRLLAREIAHARSVLVTLGKMRAEQRLASFLLEVARRNQALGYSSIEFVLRMTREEIGSYLGVTLETVSRLFSRFHQLGLIEVHGRTIKLLDRSALERILSLSAVS